MLSGKIRSLLLIKTGLSLTFSSVYKSLIVDPQLKYKSPSQNHKKYNQVEFINPELNLAPM